MLEIREEKLEAMKEVLGEERIQQLDLMISKFKDAAGVAGLISKEEENVEDVAVVEDAEVEQEVEAVEAEADVEETDDEIEEAVEVEEETEDAVADEPVEDEANVVDEVDEEVQDEFVTSEQLVQVVDFLKEAFEGVATAVEDIRKEVREVAATNQQEVLDKAHDDILMTSLASMLGAAQSVVGSKDAIVKEDEELADAAPAEEVAAPVSFIDNAIFNILEGK
jgi:hypothetical protein